GQKATLEFDWTTNEIKFFPHDKNTVEHIMVRPKAGGGHGGGDNILIRDFAAILNGDTSRSSLYDGLQSAYLCLKAKESAQKHQFIKL
ncbi:MAG: gfo/Idh/MocA family oxidoreductase, partial [Clostridia bacterium]|nr:gfo/Idh/MocA family oxidoreductase [Clostridia bacterium]